MTRPLPAAVLFDMDGTLLDTESLWLEAEHRTMAWLDATWTDADQAACLGGPLERVVDYMLRRAAPGRRAEVTESELAAYLLDTIEGLFRSSDLAWRPGAVDLLVDAHALGLPTALVTASWRRLIDVVHDTIRDRMGLDPFTVTIGGDEVSDSKPHPEPYLAAARALAVAPTDCLAIEDSPTGVASALAAGCRVIAVPHVAPIGQPVAIRESLHGTTVALLWNEARGG